jgi:hypothetical protein
MRTPLLPALVAGLGITVCALPALSPAAGHPGAADLRRLVDQLGSPSFNEREEASAALNAAGEPALTVLRDAAASDDAEIRRRAADLVRRIELRLETDHLMAPTKVKLSFKDKSVREAVAELSRQSRCPVALSDPAGKFKDRKLSLDDEEMTFWEALDRLSTLAHLAEEGQPLAAEATLMVQPPGLPPGALVPPAIARIRQVQGRALPVVGLINLVYSDRVEPPSAYAGAVRVRGRPVANGGDASHITLDVTVAAEPKVRFYEYYSLRVDKVVDDQGQELALADDTPPPTFPNWRPNSQYSTGFTFQHLQARLNAAEKPSRLLREFRGTLTGRLCTEPRPVLWTDDVLTAAGKIFSGKEGGTIKVVEASNDGSGHLTVRLELEMPPDLANPEIPGVPMRIRPMRAAAMPNGGAGVPAVAGPAPTVRGGRRVGGLCLIDDKGNAVPPSGMQLSLRRGPGGLVREYQLEFNLASGREPSKLLYEAPKVVDVEVPFALKDIRLQ